MKTRFFKIFLALVLAFSCLSGLAGCKKGSKNNETDALVIAVEELDGVFNPFFAASGNDLDVLGYMYMGLLDSDKNGNMVAGDQYATIASEYTSKQNPNGVKVDNPNDDSDYYTTYSFLLKNGLKFSDGSPITIDDVLFNLYVYLDPVYTGSVTMYSTNIRGLAKYRTQDEFGDLDSFNEAMKAEGRARITTLKNYANDPTKTADPYSYEFGDDIKKIEELFKDELKSDWNYAQSMIGEYDEEGLTEGWQIFLYLEGEITVKDKKVNNWNGWQPGNIKYESTLKDMDSLVGMIYDSYTRKSSNNGYKNFKDNLYNIITYWGTAGTALEEFTADEISKYYEQKGASGFKYKTISGIKAIRGTNEFNGRDLTEAHDVLEIVVNGVDPKAIYNFSVAIAPRKYYSTTALLDAQNAAPDTNFGVDFSQYNRFMNQVVKARKVPIGSGPYMASNVNHDDNVTDPNQFRNDGVVYLKRNDHFLFGPAKIKYINLQERNANATLGAIINDEIYFGKMPATSDTLKRANAQKKNLSYKTADTKGYGYIGINATYVPDINVRRAIMTAMNTSLCVDYYGDKLVTLIHRGLSKTNWAYPKNPEPTSYYPFDTTADYSVITEYLSKANYTKQNGKMVHRDTGLQLKLTFTIAGTGDHPMLSTFYQAQYILNEKLGCDISVRQDKNALLELSNGRLAVWAAAWGATTDPDMYQIYHKYSNANSVKSWGYPYLLANGTDEELDIIDELSEEIEKGRTVLSDDEDGKDVRREIYRKALDLVMKLAIELPTYQRSDLFVYNKNVIDASSLLEPTPNKSPIADIWNVSFK